MSSFALIVLFATFGVTLWGGFIAGPGRILPFLLLVGQLFLPAYEVYNLPGLPDLDRLTAITIPGLALMALSPPENWRRFRLVLPDLFLVGYIGWTAVCVSQNQGSWAAYSMLLSQIMRIGVPYFAGRLYLQSAEDFIALFRAVIPIVIVYLGMMLFEARFYPRFQNWVYGYNPIGLYRHGFYRPIVFAENALELGHTFSLLAVALVSVRVSGPRARALAGRYLDLGILAAVAGTMLSLSRGPITGMVLGLGAQRLLRRTGWLGALIGIFGVGFYFAMLTPYLEPARIGLGLTGNSESGQTLFYRFLQIEAYKPMVEAAPIFGYGESWDRTGPIKIIDGELLLTTLGYGVPGGLLLAALWIYSTWRLGQRSATRRRVQDQLAIRLAPLMGWLTFAAWGDAFIRTPHYLLIGALLGSLVVNPKSEELPERNPIRRWRYQFG